MFYPENYELRVVNRGLLCVLRFYCGFQYVYLFHEPTHGLLLLKLGEQVAYIYVLQVNAATSILHGDWFCAVSTTSGSVKLLV